MLSVLLAASATIRSVQGHGYMIEPPARNIIDGSGNGNCPHCGNGDKSVCGDGGQWPSSMYYVQAVQQPHRTYVAGSTVKIDISMNVNHKGHHEFFICDSAVSSNDGAVACFQKWPLRRASPEEIHTDCQVNDSREDCQPIDVNYPGRWYHPPGKSKHSIHYKIPDGLSCTHCTLLWFWPTSNSAPYDVKAYSCYQQQLRQHGWSVFDFCGWACNQAACPSNYIPTNQAPDPTVGSGFEEFRNCADIRVNPTSGGPAQVPTPFPSPLPTAPSPSTPQPTLATSSDCSGQPCSSASHCRSKWGFCGATSDYCNSESTWSSAACAEPRPTLSPTARPTLAPTLEPTSAEPEPEAEPESEPEQESEPEAEPEAEPEPELESSCRGQPCSSPLRCRSKWGYCGESIAYCNNESTWTATGCDFAASTLPVATPPAAAPTLSPTDAAQPSLCVPTNNAYSLYCAQEIKAGRCPAPWCESGGSALVQDQAKPVRKHQHFLGTSLVQRRSLVDQAEL